MLLFSCLPWSVTPAAAAPEEKSPADDCKILDYVHEEVFEEGDHLGRMEEEETLSSYVFLNKDGTRTAYYLDEAVKFVDTDGKIKEKDITLKAVLGGYATTQNDVFVTLPITMSSGVNLSYNNYQISLIPEGGTASAADIINNAAVYSDFYGEDTVLKYTPTLSGVKEDIILESYTGQNTFTFILNTNGLAVYHTPEDRYYLAPGKGTDPVYWLGALEIYDAALNMGTGEMTVDTLMAGQKYKITITVDESWLTVKGRAYPVTVDPSITINTNSGTNYIEDAPIYSGKPTKNYGTNIYNCAGYISGYGEGRTVVRLTGLINSSAYINTPEERFLSVKFYIADASGAAASTRKLYPIVNNTTWTESNVTWNSINSSYFSGNSELTGTHGYASVGRGNYAAFDITGLAQKWKFGLYNANCGFMLIGTNTSSGNGALYSSEHSTTSKRPYVVFEYATNGYESTFAGMGLFKNTLAFEELNPEPPGSVYIYHTDGLTKKTNCYGYAIGTYYSGTADSYSQKPGEFIPKPIKITVANGKSQTILNNGVSLSDYYDAYIYNTDETFAVRKEALYKLLLLDLDVFGYSVQKCDESSVPSANPSSGKRLIAAVVVGTKFHFFVQHSEVDSNGDNIWSHKNSHSTPSNKCLSCSTTTLTNDNIMEHATHGEYTGGEIFLFYITKPMDLIPHS